MWLKFGLKAQKLLAQGIALGMMAISKAPCNNPAFGLHYLLTIETNYSLFRLKSRSSIIQKLKN